MDPSTARDAVAREDFDVVVTDLNMKGVTGIDLCRHIVENRPNLPVVVLTGFGSLETAVSAIRAGAYDFISKPVAMDALTIAVDRAARHRSLRDEVARLRRQVASGLEADLVGHSPAMRHVYDLVDRLAESDATVLVTGESGTGKEVVSRIIHRRSRRHDKPFIAINCAAIPEQLLESELFGHVEARSPTRRCRRRGLFVEANGGTILLDEIGDMPIGLQPKLLRVLQERVVRPVGASTEVPIDARIIAATNRDLESAIEERRFREDLYYRINVVTVEIPPLRARTGDILPLAQRFIDDLATRTSKRVMGNAHAAAEKLLSFYAWPGNVRELRNCIERAVALARLEGHRPGRPPGEGAGLSTLARPRDERRSVGARPHGGSRASLRRPGDGGRERQQDGGGAHPRHRQKTVVSHARPPQAARRLKAHREGHITALCWLRAAVMGADDGVVSTTSLMLGVAATSASKEATLIAGVAGLVAGAMSMAAGEYVSVSSQRDAEQAAIQQEKEELKDDPKGELAEIANIYRRRGLDADLAMKVAEQLSAKDMLGLHLRDEHGLDPRNLSRPLQAALVSAGSFASLASLPIVTLLVAPDGARFMAITAASLVGLAVLGALGGYLGGAPMGRAALRVLAGGAVAMGASTLVGRLLHVAGL